MIQLRHSMSFQFEEAENFEHPTGESQTVPDQSISLQDLLKNHTMGLPIPELVPIWDEDEEGGIPDFKTMDLVDIHEMMEENKKVIAGLQAKQDELDELVTNYDDINAKAQAALDEKAKKDKKSDESAPAAPPKVG